MSSMTPFALSELLCARLCHDLAGPVGAAAAGAELFEDGSIEADAETLSLVAASAASSAARLKFFRAAFGPQVSSPQLTRTVRDNVAAYLKTQVSGALPGLTLDWQVDDPSLSGAQMRLLLNLILLAKDGLPRGGRLTVSMVDGWPRVVMLGEPAALADEAKSILLFGGEATNPKGAQAFFLKTLASELGLCVIPTYGASGLTLALQGEKSASI